MLKIQPVVISVREFFLKTVEGAIALIHNPQATLAQRIKYPINECFVFTAEGTSSQCGSHEV